MRSKLSNTSLQFAFLTAAFFIHFLPQSINGQDVTKKTSPTCKTIVIGFVGGVRQPEDVTQGVVQIGNRLKTLNQSGLQVSVYRHWDWKKAYQEIYQSFDQNGDERLTTEELRNAPKIVIYGHSLGGWAVTKLSRKLEKKEIPVELSVQIDSVGVGDEVVPSNVKTAANYYQKTVPVLRGEKKIKAEDEKKTKIEGNFLLRDVGHEEIARRDEISNFIIDHVQKLAICTISASASPIALRTHEN